MAGSPSSSVRGGFPLGLPGATLATRYVGATASGAPASGTFAVGDYVVGRDGAILVCTVAGSPGTWVSIGASAANPPGYEFGYDAITGNVTVSSATEATGTSVIACAAHTFDGGAVMVQGIVNIECGASSAIILSLFEGATQISRLCEVIPGTLASSGFSIPIAYRFTPTAAAHTYTVTGHKAGVNNGAVVAGAGGTATYPPCFVRFVKV